MVFVTRLCDSWERYKQKNRNIQSTLGHGPRRAHKANCNNVRLFGFRTCLPIVLALVRVFKCRRVPIQLVEHRINDEHSLEVAYITCTPWMMAIRASGRRHGDLVRLPIDVSSRAFRRARSAPRFPFDMMDSDWVKLKDFPIKFCWGSERISLDWDLAEHPSSPARISPELVVHTVANRPVLDPHRVGFGPIPAHPPQFRSPPSISLTAGIVGSNPSAATRGPRSPRKRRANPFFPLPQVRIVPPLPRNPDSQT